MRSYPICMILGGFSYAFLAFLEDILSGGCECPNSGYCVTKIPNSSSYWSAPSFSLWRLASQHWDPNQWNHSRKCIALFFNVTAAPSQRWARRCKEQSRQHMNALKTTAFKVNSKLATGKIQSTSRDFQSPLAFNPHSHEQPLLAQRLHFRKWQRSKHIAPAQWLQSK